MKRRQSKQLGKLTKDFEKEFQHAAQARSDEEK